MKRIALFARVFFALLAAFLIGSQIANFAQCSPLVPAAVLFGFSVLMPLAGGLMKRTNAAYDGVYVEAWTGELVKRFRFGRTWLSRIPRYDNLVKNKVIHLVDVGADPQVFLNLAIDSNNPVPTSTREDGDIPISLDRWDTENTRVSLTELRSISYDKMAVTLDLHMNAMADKAAVRAAWRLAPTQASNILSTTGASDNRAVAKKRITPDDFVMMSETVAVPTDEGGPGWPDDDKLIAVLDFRHVADLQKLDQNFDKQWRNAQTGELFPYNGWMVYKFSRNAKYTKTGGVYTRKAFAAAVDPANDLHSSLFFYADRAFACADLGYEMFYRTATTDPELPSNTVGFRGWNYVGPKKLDGFYSLVSDKV